jgi:transcriptional regulator CtsR
MAQGAYGHDILLDEFLQNAGTKCDVYFTVEQGFSTNGSSHLFEVQEVKATNTPEVIDQVLSLITNSITNLTVLQDRSNKRIYHLIDRSLIDADDYTMIRVLDVINFKGNGAEFVRIIGQSVPNLLNELGYDPMFGCSNTATDISIDSAKVSVRDALSNGINLHGYNRLIWTAYTTLETHKTKLHFIGPLIDFGENKGVDATRK